MTLRGLVAVFLALAARQACAKAPNIVLLVADDMGWNDIGWNNPDIKTPNLDQLAYGGVILNQSYVQPVCSPSRSAFLSGLYPFKTGMQHGTIGSGQAKGVPLNITLLPRKLRDLGYSTHMVGKWHLGFCKWEYTPTFRGFDSFYGFYNGARDYYTHNTGRYFDFRNGKKVVSDQDGIYSTFGYSARAQKLISEHDQSKPMFLYMAFQIPHTPLEVPSAYEAKFGHIVNNDRRTLTAMVSVLDEAVGNITDSLKAAGMFDDTIIVFTSDNGGAPGSGGNNWPLRGEKATFWEGGIRAPGMVHSKLMKKTGYVTNNLVHISDWYSTFISAAGGTPDAGVDGVDQWKSLSEDGPPVRTEIVHNIDDVSNVEVIRSGNYKLVLGNPGRNSDWTPVPTSNTLRRAVKDSVSEKARARAALYDMAADPLETTNLATSQRARVNRMKAMLTEHKKKMMPAWVPDSVDAANPSNFGGVYSPGWC